MEPLELPPPIAALWEPRARSSRGGLSVERVVAAAVAIADDGGLEAVAMGRVAKALGFTPMALYRHVRNKDELVALMVEAVLDDPPAASGRWRADLEAWARALLTTVRAHPWTLDVPLARMPFGPRRLAWLDRGLAALEGTPLAPRDKAGAILLLNNHVFAQARIDADLDQDGATALLGALADRERFPALRRALDAGLTFDDDPGDEFTFGLERLLDGIGQLVTDGSAPPGGS